MSPDAMLVTFAIIGALLFLVCCWPEGPRVDQECDEQVYGTVEETSCVDLNNGRPCEVCRDEEGDPLPAQIEHIDVDPKKVSGDRQIKGFRRG